MPEFIDARRVWTDSSQQPIDEEDATIYEDGTANNHQMKQSTAQDATKRC